MAILTQLPGGEGGPAVPASFRLGFGGRTLGTGVAVRVRGVVGLCHDADPCFSMLETFFLVI